MWRPPGAIRHPLPDPMWPTEEEAAASRLFQPLAAGRVSLETRTWVPAMVPWRATDEGFVTPNVLEWYRRFARGRPGALVVEATGVRDVPSGPLLRAGHDRFIPGLRRLTSSVREASEGHTRVFLQILDFLTVRRRPDPAKFFDRFLTVTPRHRVALAALTGERRWIDASEASVRGYLREAPPGVHDAVLSPRERDALLRGYRERVTDLHLPHVRDLPRTLPGIFAAAAARAREAGFDGVELHYAHAYTMASFLSRTNDRGDGYGKTEEGRLRLPLEVYRAVRAKAGEDWVVGCRMLGDESIEGGSRIEDACRFAIAFAREGMDFLSISKGGKFEDAAQPRVGEAVYPYTGPSGYECMPAIFSDARGPFARNVPLAAAIRRAVRGAGFAPPIVAAGGIGTFALAEGILRRGEADIIAAARQSLADPDWWLKMRLGRGKEIRRCEYTNYCEALDQRHRAVTCKLWDRRDLDDPGVPTTGGGRRRLVAPPWPAGWRGPARPPRTSAGPRPHPGPGEDPRPAGPRGQP